MPSLLLALCMGMYISTAEPKPYQPSQRRQVAALDKQQQCIHTNNSHFWHPACSRGLIPTQPRVYDLTPALQRILARHYGVHALIYNPSLVHIQEDLYYWFMRVWMMPEGSDSSKGQAAPLGGWTLIFHPVKGCSMGVLDAIIQLDTTTGEPLRLLHHKLMGRIASGSCAGLGTTNRDVIAGASELREDVRAFKDANGTIRLLHISRATVSASTRRSGPFGCHSGESHMTRVRIEQAANGSFAVHLDEHVLLPYTRLPGVHPYAEEKNFAPWSGTNLMSYSHFPHGFDWHSVWDWKDYDRLPHQHAFASQAPTPFFDRLYQYASRRGIALGHAAGGTPAIRHGSGWLAAGHKEEAMACFHDDNSSMSGSSSYGSSTSGRPGAERRCVPSRLSELLCADRRLVGATYYNWHVEPTFTQDYRQKHGDHQVRDYFMFLYRFEASAPYRITHVSHFLKPLPSGATSPHRGVIFPIGIELLGDGVMISYGEDDESAKLLVLSGAQLEAMLMPVEPLSANDEAIGAHQYCTVATSEKAIYIL